VGVVCLIGWLARLGVVANLLSRPVLVGYMAGIGLLMVVSQYGKLTRLTITGNAPWEETASLFAQLGAVHVPTLVLGLAV
ncbi:SulP family inorganic anion transporter, partial [Sedimentibacter sp. B4]|uniref:SulP family inorganic anion transporter n=1 Tax=Sedimentibacter sp. B4 TaxID=304766 RepID=UPI0018DCE68F